MRWRLAGELVVPAAEQLSLLRPNKNPRPAPRCDGVEGVGRGYAKQPPYSNREPGFFVVAVGEFFSVCRDWHQDDRARPLVRQYQRTLDAVLRKHPGLASCAVYCCRCKIRFLTHPRNANRRDLCCEFGCRELHRRELANARSQKHYRTDQGRRNKKQLNGKRSAAIGGGESGVSPEAAPPDVAPADVAPASSETSSAVESVSLRPPAPAAPAPAVARAEAPAEDVEFTREGWASGTPAAAACGGLGGAVVKLSLGGFTLDEATLVNSPLLPYLAMVASLLEGRTIRRAELLQTLRKSLRQRSFDSLPRREYVLRFLNQHPP